MGDWHLDKRVNVSVILAVVANAVAFAWWAATMTADSNTQKAQIAEVRAQVEEVQTVLSQQGRENVMLAERVEATNDNLNRMSGELTQLNALLRELLRELPRP